MNGLNGPVHLFSWVVGFSFLRNWASIYDLKPGSLYDYEGGVLRVPRGAIASNVHSHLLPYLAHLLAIIIIVAIWNIESIAIYGPKLLSFFFFIYVQYFHTYHFFLLQGI